MTLQDLQCAVQAGNYYLARQCFLELLTEPDAPLPQVFCEMAVAEFQNGNTRTALTFSEAGEKLLTNQLRPDQELVARLRNSMVAFYREVGDVSRAISLGRQWLESAGQDVTPGFRRGQIMYNTALAFRQRGGPHDNAEALRYYDFARTTLQQTYDSATTPEDRERSRLLQVMTLQNEAWLLCEMGEVDQAEEYAKLAAKLLVNTDGAQKLEQVLLGAYIAYNRQDLTKCETLLKDLQTSVEKATPRQQFWIEWLAARISLLHNQRMLADVHATLAVAEAERTKEVYLMRLAAELEREVKAAR